MICNFFDFREHFFVSAERGCKASIVSDLDISVFYFFFTRKTFYNTGGNCAQKEENPSLPQ